MKKNKIKTKKCKDCIFWKGMTQALFQYIGRTNPKDLEKFLEILKSPKVK